MKPNKLYTPMKQMKQMKPNTLHITNKFNQSQINTLRNYASQHIYNIIDVRYLDMEPQEKKLKINSIFKELVNKIRFITTTPELDSHNSPMSFLFQHIRPTIIKLVANCSSKNEKEFIDKGLTNNLDWCIRFYKALLSLGAKDIIIWFFFHIPYYNSYSNHASYAHASYESHASYETLEIEKQRNIYIKLLEWMEINWSIADYFTESEFVFISNETCMPYAIAYHNQNNVNILSKYCKLLRKICPWLNYYSPRLAETLFKKQYINSHANIYTKQDTNQDTLQTTKQDTLQTTLKKRICFISDSFTTDTSVLRDRISIIGKLDRNKYDVYFASFYPFDVFENQGSGSVYSVAKVFMIKMKNNYIHLGNDLSSARSVLERYKFDFIVYPDIGMKLLPTLLAYSRIAPIQITTWGHSETSGIDTIDYFISSFIFENEIAKSQSNYTEKLILFNSLGTYYISPHKLFVENNDLYKNKSKIFKTRKEIGLGLGLGIRTDGTDNTHIYVCLQTFYKLTPEFETCLARILELDPLGIILLSNTFPFCKSHLERLLSIIGLEKMQRIKWIGALEKDEFLNMVSISDVCLDPFPFGGFNTSYDAFDYNIPVITMDNCEFLHGRFTSGLYKKMGLDECIVQTAEQYAQLASSIGINEKLRHKIMRNIEMKKHLIFQEQESVNEWNNIFNILE